MVENTMEKDGIKVADIPGAPPTVVEGIVIFLIDVTPPVDVVGEGEGSEVVRRAGKGEVEEGRGKDDVDSGVLSKVVSSRVPGTTVVILEGEMGVATAEGESDEATAGGGGAARRTKGLWYWRGTACDAARPIQASVTMVWSSIASCEVKEQKRLIRWSMQASRGPSSYGRCRSEGIS